MPFKFNRLTLLASNFSLQFTDISEYQPSSCYRASESGYFWYIHCKFWRVFPTTKMTSATVKPSILLKDTHLSEDLISMEPAMYARQTLNLWGTQHFKVKSLNKTYTYPPCCLLRRSRSKSACLKLVARPFFSFVRLFKFSGELPLYTRSQTPVPRSPFPVPRSRY